MAFVIIFFAFVGLISWSASYALKNGTPNQLLNPVDGDGNLCGVDIDGKDYTDFGKLFYIIQVVLPEAEPPVVFSSRNIDSNFTETQATIIRRSLVGELGLGIDLNFTIDPVCANLCPLERESPIECMGTVNVTEEVCRSMTVDPFTGVGRAAYGSYELFGKICFPNPDKMPPLMEED